MNAYIASFMLLLFNAVGLAVPASAAAEERMMPELGSAAQLAEAEGVSQAEVIESSVAAVADQGFMAATALPVSPDLALAPAASRKPDWAVVAMRSDTGDKLEHEEGAP
jgi:hypothetical protein